MMPGPSWGGGEIVLGGGGESAARPTTDDAIAARLLGIGSRQPKEPRMAFTGQTIENPVSGERITFLQTARDTRGEKLEIELELSPDGHVPGAHVHPEQTETFHVLE